MIINHISEVYGIKDFFICVKGNKLRSKLYWNLNYLNPRRKEKGLPKTIESTKLGLKTNSTCLLHFFTSTIGASKMKKLRNDGRYTSPWALSSQPRTSINVGLTQINWSELSRALVKSMNSSEIVFQCTMRQYLNSNREMKKFSDKDLKMRTVRTTKIMMINWIIKTLVMILKRKQLKKKKKVNLKYQF